MIKKALVVLFCAAALPAYAALDPAQVRQLAAEGALPGARVGEECACEEGCLRYDKAAQKR